MIDSAVRRAITTMLKALTFSIFIHLSGNMDNEPISKFCFYTFSFVMINHFFETEYMARKMSHKIWRFYKSANKMWSNITNKKIYRKSNVNLNKRPACSSENQNRRTNYNVRAALRHETPMFFYYCSCKKCTFLGQPDDCAQRKCHMCSPNSLRPQISRGGMGGDHQVDWHLHRLKILYLYILCI